MQNKLHGEISEVARDFEFFRFLFLLFLLFLFGTSNLYIFFWSLCLYIIFVMRCIFCKKVLKSKYYLPLLARKRSGPPFLYPYQLGQVHLTRFVTFYKQNRMHDHPPWCDGSLMCIYPYNHHRWLASFLFFSFLVFSLLINICIDD